MNSTGRMASRVARVARNERLGGGCHRLELRVEGDWPATCPGQFAMLSVDDPGFPILPRPFSLLGAREERGETRLEFLIMPVGVGTALLCGRRPGEAIDAVGPLGRRMDEPVGDGAIVCVAGGYGIAPFVFLLDHWRRERDPRVGRTTVVFGARCAEKLFLAERLLPSGARVELCTDDGSRGFRGRVSERLRALLADGPAPGLVLTCGPEPMMEAVGEICREARVACRASLETVMGCGYAVCNGCAVAVNDPAQPDGYTFELACREGTVFDEERLLWTPG